MTTRSCAVLSSSSCSTPRCALGMTSCTAPSADTIAAVAATSMILNFSVASQAKHAGRRTLRVPKWLMEGTLCPQRR